MKGTSCEALDLPNAEHNRSKRLQAFLVGSVTINDFERDKINIKTNLSQNYVSNYHM